MRKEVDGEYGKSAFIETRAERIVPMTRRLARPYFRVGLILSVCLSVRIIRGGRGSTCRGNVVSNAQNAQ